MVAPIQGVASQMAWSIVTPGDKSFVDSETDGDVALLKGYVANIYQNFDCINSGGTRYYTFYSLPWFWFSVINLAIRFLLKLHTWLEDPIENDSILSGVIDLPSLAQFFLLHEFTREADGYKASMYFKVIDGKLYHASPWCVYMLDHPLWLRSVSHSSSVHYISLDLLYSLFFVHVARLCFLGLNQGLCWYFFQYYSLWRPEHYPCSPISKH